MINFLIVLFIVFIKQALFIAAFCLAISINSYGSYFIPIILLLLYLISHFIHSKRIYRKLKLDKVVFNIYGFISWILIGGINIGLLFDTYLWDLLPRTGSMFSGMEYILVPILLGIYLVVLIVIKVIIYIFKYLKIFINTKINKIS